MRQRKKLLKSAAYFLFITFSPLRQPPCDPLSGPDRRHSGSRNYIARSRFLIHDIHVIHRLRVTISVCATRLTMRASTRGREAGRKETEDLFSPTPKSGIPGASHGFLSSERASDADGARGGIARFSYRAKAGKSARAAKELRLDCCIDARVRLRVAPSRGEQRETEGPDAVGAGGNASPH